MIGSDQKLIIDDTSQDPRFAEISGEQRRSIVCLPLHHRGRTMGCVYLSSSRLNRFTQTVLDVLTILSTRASLLTEVKSTTISLTPTCVYFSEACIAIGNAMLFKKLQRATQANLKMIVKCVARFFHRSGASSFLIRSALPLLPSLSQQKALDEARRSREVRTFVFSLAISLPSLTEVCDEPFCRMRSKRQRSSRTSWLR